jgi:hypothetical protein
MGSFFDALLQRHVTWRHIALVARTGHGWCGLALVVPPPAESCLSGPLDIEDVGGEVTISFDHSHIHMTWPPAGSIAIGPLWGDPLALIDAIVNETVVSVSGWIDGHVRIGSIQEADKFIDLSMSDLQHIRIRSWRGTLDRDYPSA